MLNLILTGKRKLHEVTHQPLSLGSFTFWKAWVRGQNQLSKKRQERNLRMEGNATVMLYAMLCMLSVQISQGFTFTTTRCSLQLT